MTMASDYQLKLRSPLGVFFLALITAGVYYLYWYYRANEEAAIIAGDDDAQPAVSLVAVIIGGLGFLLLLLHAFLIAVPLVALFIVSHWRTAARVGSATQLPAGALAQVILSVLLAPFAPLLYTWWLQGKLNKVGRRQRASASGAMAAA